MTSKLSWLYYVPSSNSPSLIEDINNWFTVSTLTHLTICWLHHSCTLTDPLNTSVSLIHWPLHFHKHFSQFHLSSPLPRPSWVLSSPETIITCQISILRIPLWPRHSTLILLHPMQPLTYNSKWNFQYSDATTSLLSLLPFLFIILLDFMIHHHHSEHSP